MNWAKEIALSAIALAGTAGVTSADPPRADAACSVPVIVHADGSIEFDGSHVANDEKLAALLAEYHKQNPKCAMRISANEVLNFEAVGRVIFAMQKVGIAKVGFLTEPKNN